MQTSIPTTTLEVWGFKPANNPFYVEHIFEFIENPTFFFVQSSNNVSCLLSLISFAIKKNNQQLKDSNRFAFKDIFARFFAFNNVP